jgi:PAS domain S-box-containing protein
LSTEPERESPLEGALWELVRTTSMHSGAQFFQQLTCHLARALNVHVAAISELVDREHLRPLSVWAGADWFDADEHSIAGSPCGVVVESRQLCATARDVQKRFPEDSRLVEWNIESYMGAPLVDGNDRVIGLLCVMDRAPLEDDHRRTTILDAFASRAALELDRIRTVRQLEEQRAFLRQVLDINPSLIFAKDRRGRFTLVNRAVADAYGTSVEGLTGKTDADFNANEDEVESFRRMDLEVMDTLQDHFIPEERLTDARGRVRWLQTIKRAIVSEDGSSNQVLGVATDITELKKTREELLERQRRDHEAVESELDKIKGELVRHTRLAAIGQVAASIAHELRNPLGAISNAVFFLGRRQPDLDVKWARHLEIIREEVRASDRIVTDLLEMSRARQPAKEPTDLETVARRAFRRAAGNRTAELRLQLDPDPLQVRADPEQLHRVLHNLMLNALQSMPEGGTVTVEGRQEQDVDVVTVRDDGAGIEPAIRDDLFEPLFTTRAKGTGLGLAICRQIVERHQGTIRLLPSEVGAAFEIRLPRT